MKHSAWLQDCTPAQAPKKKTLYEMGHNKKPHLAGIQEFGAAAFVKDLAAGKLDVGAKKGQFVGYDSELKGYRIYWPEKRLITVEQNVVFNQDNVNTYNKTAIIYGKVQSEEKKEKVIQTLQNNADNVKTPEDKELDNQSTQQNSTKPHLSPKQSNSIPFLSSNKPQFQPDAEPHDDNQSSNPQYGHGQRVRPQQGHYKALNEGLVAAITAIVEEPKDDSEDEVEVEPLDNVVKDPEDPYRLLPDISLLGYSSMDLKDT
jgi:hypothetical protein